MHRHTIMHHLVATYMNALAYLEAMERKYESLEKVFLGRSSVIDLQLIDCRMDSSFVTSQKTTPRRT